MFGKHGEPAWACECTSKLPLPVGIGSILTDFWCSQVAGLPAAAEWVLVNNRFGSPDRAAWNKVGLLLTGGAAGGSTTTTLSSQASVSKPRSQLLFGPAW
jgi:hypothetical protein